MPYHRWKDIKHKNSAEDRERIRREAITELLEMNLKNIRQATGMTQAQVAKALKITQGQVSLTEQREDHRLSTLRRYVEALGGELEVIANFGDRRVRLHGV
jgi:DNA-binding transcriptional regulator YiaG